MKKLLSLLLALLILSCSTAFADNLAGTYKVTQMTEDGEDVSEQLALLDGV